MLAEEWASGFCSMTLTGANSAPKSVITSLAGFPRITRARRRHHARLLHGLERTIHDRDGRLARAVSRLLDGRVPSATRLCGVWPCARGYQVNTYRNGRTRIYTLRLPSAS